MDYLKKSILSALAFFAANEQALTLLELQNFLFRTDIKQQPVGLDQLKESLEELSNLIENENGLYYLKGFEKLAALRIERYNNTLVLLRKAAFFAAGLRFVPYIKAAAISGSVAVGNASAVSDIDLFIITRPHRLFLARTLVSAYFQFFGGRRYGKKIAGRFCLNHYVTAGLQLGQDRNFYTAVEYSSLIPVFGAPQIKKFWKENCFWIKNFLLNPSLPWTHLFEHTNTEESLVQKALELILTPISGVLERILRHFQKRRIRQGEFIVVLDSELSFHPGSKGQQTLKRYYSLLNKLGNKALDKGAGITIK